MRLHSDRSERGQSLVIVTLLLIALIGMLAIVLDGGYAYLQRRIAQNAADAGALAGAREWCMTKNADQAVARALEYAVDRNGAVEADASVDSGEVTVNARIPFQTAFGRIFGQPEITAIAEAAAGCFVPGAATGALPVAWSCRPPAAGWGSEPIKDCEIQYGKTYIIMDSPSTGSDVYCQDPPNSGEPPGSMDCDYDNDGADDIVAGGNRSWLDLNGGGGGSNELANWILGGYGVELKTHTWFGGQTGVANNVFQAAATRVGQDLILPIFDYYCDQSGALPSTMCPSLYHYGPDPIDTTVAGGGAAAVYFHIITFAVFHITCVDAPGVPGPACPGKKAAVDAGTLPHNAKTIEGYFVEDGIVPGLSGKPSEGADMGAYTLYLTR